MKVGQVFQRHLIVLRSTQPAALVTEKLYVPGARPDMVVLDPDAVVITLPGYLLSVHVPGIGRPLSTTLPVPTVQVGAVMAPTRGADGMAG